MSLTLVPPLDPEFERLVRKARWASRLAWALTTAAVFAWRR